MNVCNCCEWSCVLKSTMHCTAVYDLLLNVTDLFCKQHRLKIVQDRGPSAKVDVAETVAFRFGRYEGWWHVNKVKTRISRIL